MKTILIERTDKVHFFSDSCGRLTRLLSAFISMKHSLPLKKHSDQKSYYALMGPTPKSENLYHAPEEFLDLYRSLEVLT